MARLLRILLQICLFQPTSDYIQCIPIGLSQRLWINAFFNSSKIARIRPRIIDAEQAERQRK
jgi:hypothetical protein